MKTSLLIWLGGLFLFLLISGIWTSRTRGSLSSFRLTIHKFFGLGIGGLLIYILSKTGVVVLQEGKAMWLLVVVIALFIGNVATGGFLSAKKEMPVWVLRVHQALPALTIITSGALLYFLWQ